MKLNILKYITLSLVASACSYEFPEPDASTIPSAGTADFTKTVAVGSSLTAGFMNGALYDAGQANSFPAILATQFKLAGGGDFNQPDINAVDGYYGVAGDIILGRLYLKGTASPKPTPKIPGQAITAYAGDKSKLNNFSAYGVSAGASLAPQLGGPPTSNPYFNPYYSRFASNPGTSTVIGDAASALDNGGTFLIFWLGNDDVLGYATNGANQNDPTKPITSEGAFSTAYNTALTALLGVDASVKGVVANIPDITSLPYFTTVPYKPIPLDQPTATQLTTDLANNYNAFLTGMVGATVITQEEANKRMLTFVAGANSIVIDDETLTDLDTYMAGPYAGLKPYRRARQTTAADLVVLPAAAVLGTLVGNDATKINGVTVPLSDTYILLPGEITEVQSRIDAFNGIIADAVADNSARLALIDVNEILAALKTSGATGVTVNGLAITATISPPYGGFSLDGIHPNARGNAYLANKFIEVINEKFDANVPLSNPNNYPGNDLPIP
jgi:hypothetical protein